MTIEHSNLLYNFNKPYIKRAVMIFYKSCVSGHLFLSSFIQGDTQNYANFWKTQQKLKKCNKKNFIDKNWTITTCLLTLRLLMSYIYIYIYIYIYMEHLFLMFLDHTRHSTVGRTPLDEWSAHRRDLYLTTHDTHNRQISMPPVGFEPKISAGERQGRCVWSRNIKNGCSIYIYIYIYITLVA